VVSVLVCITVLSAAAWTQNSSFLNPVLYPVIVPVDLTVGDFNGDSHPDIAVSGYSNTGGSAVMVLKGVGDGTFVPGATFGVGLTPGAIVAADFNNDGKLDLAVDSASGIVVFLGKGDGTFTRVAGAPLAGGGRITAADVNGDGKMDLIMAGVQVFLGNGDGTFQPGRLYPASATPLTGIVAADFNGDNHPDIATLSGGAMGSVHVLLNKGDGTFAPAVNYPIASADGRSIAAADFRQSGKIDLVVSDHTDNQICTLTGKGDGTFQSGGCFFAGSEEDGIAVDDFNLDGFPDAVIADDLIGAVSVMQGASSGNFTLGLQVDLFHTSPRIATADFNGDGKPDLAVIEDTFGVVAILLNNTPFPPNRVVRLLTILPPVTQAGVSLQVSVDALNGNDQPVPTYAGTVHFTSSDPQAVLPPDSQLTSGVGFFMATLKTLGQQTITATDKANPKLTSTTSINVIAGPAAKLAVVAPATATPVASIAFTVTALDQFNNVASAYGGTVHFTSSDAIAVLPADSTLTNSFGSFSATLKTLGIQTISVNDKATPGVQGTSGPILVANNTLAVSSSQNPAYFQHTSVTYTVLVAPVAAGAAPTGTVTFFDGAVSLGSQALDGTGRASITVQHTRIGAHRITVTYGGDANYSPSLSPAFIQMSSPAPRPVP